MDELSLKKNLGANIKRYRKRLNLTQEALSEKLNRNQRQISLIEKGLSFPNPYTLIKMTEVFNCSIKDLFDFEIIEASKNIRKELQNIISYLPDEKLKVLYIVSKNL